MKKSDLYREWARVIDMCTGTGIMPLSCLRFDGHLIKQAIEEPDFSYNPNRFSFAVCIVESRPVFVNDILWAKQFILPGLAKIKILGLDGPMVQVLLVDSPESLVINKSANVMTWTPPETLPNLHGVLWTRVDKSPPTLTIRFSTLQSAINARDVMIEKGIL